MGILRIEPWDSCGDDVAAELDAAPDRSEKFAALATFGIDAASRPVPVVARNSLRSMLDDLRGLFMRSPQRYRCCASPSRSRAALYDAFCSGKLSHSLRFEGSKRRNRARHRKHALRRTLLLLNRLHKHFDGLTCIGRNKNGRSQQPAAHPCLARFRQAIATGERQVQPALAIALVGHFLTGLGPATGHPIILPS